MPLDHLEQLTESWAPDPASFGVSPLGRMAACHGMTDIASVHRRAQEDPNWYWAATAEDLGMRWMTPYETVADLSDGIEFPHFFAGGRLNWADNCVDRWVEQGRGNALALWWEGDDGARRDLTYDELKESVDRAAGALLADGLQVGEPVGLVLPMVPEAAIAVLGVAKAGGIVVPMFSGYGSVPIRERLQQCGARIVITCDSFPRRGRLIPLKETVDAAITGLAVQRLLVVRRTGIGAEMSPVRDRWWDEELRQATPLRQAVSMSAEDPCLLLFTSGSTGTPKGCVHTHAGLPVKLSSEARHAMDFDETGRLLWVTDMGWVMGSFVIASAFGNGGTAVFFEGTPDWPEPDRLWQVCERAGVTLLGISPTAVRSLLRHGDSWPDQHHLESLRTIASTGEPWNTDPWLWCFRHVGKERIPVLNFSGGTECGGGLVAGSMGMAVKPTAFNGPALGVATDVVDDDGRPVRGQVGELVVRAPWPGMTNGLWGDNEKYLDTYWRRFPGLWHQGDFAYVDGAGYWYLLGRSDDTIKLSGKRVGPAEVETALVGDEDVIEAAAVGVPDQVAGEALLAFVVARGGADGDALRSRLKVRVRADLGASLVPKEICVVAELPKTRSGKILRRVLRAVYLGLPTGDLSSLDNPGSLADLPKRQPSDV